MVFFDSVMVVVVVVHHDEGVEERLVLLAGALETLNDR